MVLLLKNLIQGKGIKNNQIIVFTDDLGSKKARQYYSLFATNFENSLSGRCLKIIVDGCSDIFEEDCDVLDIRNLLIVEDSVKNSLQTIESKIEKQTYQTIIFDNLEPLLMDDNNQNHFLIFQFLKNFTNSNPAHKILIRCTRFFIDEKPILTTNLLKLSTLKINLIKKFNKSEFKISNKKGEEEDPNFVVKIRLTTSQMRVLSGVFGIRMDFGQRKIECCHLEKLSYLEKLDSGKVLAAEKLRSMQNDNQVINQPKKKEETPEEILQRKLQAAKQMKPIVVKVCRLSVQFGLGKKKSCSLRAKRAN